jgi:hypothetical protein
MYPRQLVASLFYKEVAVVSWKNSTTPIKKKKYNICCLQFHKVGRDRVDFGSSENSLPLAALG